MLVALCLSLSLVAAPSEAALREQLAPYLGTIDRPISTEDWRRLPPEALPVLERIAADPSAFATQRALALDGAAALGSDGQLHRRLATDPDAPLVLRHAALRALPSVLAPAEAQRVLEGLMGADADPGLRGASAKVIARAFPARGCAGVRAQWKREDRVGRAALQRALTECEGK